MIEKRQRYNYKLIVSCKNKKEIYLGKEYFRENDPTIYAFRQQLYSRERYVRYRPGTLLLYRHDLWHRGTPMKSDGATAGGDGMRLVLNMVFKKLGEVCE